MGVIDWFTFRRWPRPTGTPDVTLDLSCPSLGGVRLGDQEAAVAKRFGPPASSRHMRRRGTWLYPAWGISFEVERGRVAAFGATAQRDEGAPPRAVARRWRGYRGEVVLRGGDPARRTDRLTPEALWEAFGAPYNVEEGSEEVVLYYRFGGWSMDVEFLPDGRFTHVSAFLPGRPAAWSHRQGGGPRTAWNASIRS